MPSRMARAFVTPPPSDSREFASYMLRGLPAISLTSLAMIELSYGMDYANTYIGMGTQGLLALESLVISFLVIPMSVAAIRATRGIERKIDALIMRRDL